MNHDRAHAPRGMQPVTLCVTALDAQRPGAIDINPFDNLSIQRNVT